MSDVFLFCCSMCYNLSVEVSVCVFLLFLFIFVFLQREWPARVAILLLQVADLVVRATIQPINRSARRIQTVTCILPMHIQSLFELNIHCVMTNMRNRCRCRQISSSSLWLFYSQLLLRAAPLFGLCSFRNSQSRASDRITVGRALATIASHLQQDLRQPAAILVFSASSMPFLALITAIRGTYSRHIATFGDQIFIVFGNGDGDFGPCLVDADDLRAHSFERGAAECWVGNGGCAAEARSLVCEAIACQMGGVNTVRWKCCDTRRWPLSRHRRQM